MSQSAAQMICSPQVHDYQGASLFRMDANVKAASRQIIRLFQVRCARMN